MTSAVKINLKILNDAVKKIKAANNKEKAKELIKLYEERKISNAKSVTNQLFDFIAYESKTPKQKETIDKNHSKLIEKFQNAPTSSETQRKAKKENKAARKIQKLVTGRIKLEASIFDRAMNKNLISVEVKPVGKGDMLVGDLEATLARAYLLAKRTIPQWGDFKIFGSIKYELTSMNKDGATDVVNHTTKSYPKSQLAQFFQQLTGFFSTSEYAERLDINSLRVQFHFAQMPTGKGCGTTERDLESVFNKRSFENCQR